MKVTTQFYRGLICRFFIAPFLSLALICSNASPLPAQTVPRAPLPDDLIPEIAAIKIPSRLGKIQESFQGTTGRSVIVIQDAHAVPDAQRSIQKLIEYFQDNVGINLTTVEGASSTIDLQILNSFPDLKFLEKKMEVYFQQGELTGALAASIFNSGKMIYHGIEHRPLYEEGLLLYRKALKNSEELRLEIEKQEKELWDKKKSIYSPALLQVDRAISDFHSNPGNLSLLLRTLSSVKAPGADTELSALFEMLESKNQSDLSFEQEVRKKTKILLPLLNQKDLRIFNARYQSFQVSEQSAESFAVYLKKLSARYGVPVKFTKGLEAASEQHMKMENLEGTQIFNDLELYIREVKSAILENDAQRELDRKTEALFILKRLAGMEITHAQWNALQNPTPDLVSPDLITAHFDFYQNAQEREFYFFDNLEKRMIAHRRHSAILVAGGFHAQGLLQKFKEKGISYILVNPRILELPENLRYQDLMRGDVSWKEYFQVKNGKVNLYEAFIRAVRDRLLEGDENFSSIVIKKWRDQIIRDMASQGKISEIRKYTRFLDELPARKQNFPPWRARLERFVEGLRNLDFQKNWTAGDILNVPGAAAALQAAGGNASGSAADSVPAEVLGLSDLVAKGGPIELPDSAPGRQEVRAEDPSETAKSSAKALQPSRRGFHEFLAGLVLFFLGVWSGQFWFSSDSSKAVPPSGVVSEQLIPASLVEHPTNTGQLHMPDLAAGKSPFDSVWTDLYREAVQSVVLIEAAVGGANVSYGTGFIVDAEKGLIVTSYHGVGNVTNPKVVLRSGEEFSGEKSKVVLVDKKNDLVLIQIQTEKKQTPTGLKALPITSERDIPVGMKIAIIGHPHGKRYINSMAMGTVSGVRRTLRYEGNDVVFHQTTAPIYKGNSGGPVLAVNPKNGKPVVLGMAVANYADTLIGFWVPSNDITQLIENYRKRSEFRSSALVVLNVAVLGVGFWVGRMTGSESESGSRQEARSQDSNGADRGSPAGFDRRSFLEKLIGGVALYLLGLWVGSSRTKPPQPQKRGEVIPVVHTELAVLTEPITPMAQPGAAAGNLIEETQWTKLYREAVESIAYITIPGTGGKIHYGTGFIVDAQEGLIVTALHVIGEKAGNASIFLSGGKQFRRADLEVVAIDKQNDLALIRINVTPDKLREAGLKALAFPENEKIPVGMEVATIGNPFGEDYRNSFSRGIVSGADRDLEYGNARLKAHQTTVAINLGNSGGPLLAPDPVTGKPIVLGAVVAVRGTSLIGFFIPFQSVKELIQRHKNRSELRLFNTFNFVGTGAHFSHSFARSEIRSSEASGKMAKHFWRYVLAMIVGTILFFQGFELGEETVAPTRDRVVGAGAFEDPELPSMPPPRGKARSVFDDKWTQAYQEAAQSVVFITAPEHGKTKNSMGTGFIVDSEKGLIVTALHVVGNDSKPKVRLQDGEIFWLAGTSRVVATDRANDLALIQIKPLPDQPALKLKALSILTDQVPVGTEVGVIGNPFGEKFEFSFSTGILSGAGRKINLNGDKIPDTYQTDAVIYSGNSGGPAFVIDRKGALHVIGLTDAVREDATLISFLIQANRIKELVDKFRQRSEVRWAFILFLTSGPWEMGAFFYRYATTRSTSSKQGPPVEFYKRPGSYDDGVNVKVFPPIMPELSKGSLERIPHEFEEPSQHALSETVTSIIDALRTGRPITPVLANEIERAGPWVIEALSRAGDVALHRDQLNAARAYAAIQRIEKPTVISYDFSKLGPDQALMDVMIGAVQSNRFIAFRLIHSGTYLKELQKYLPLKKDSVVKKMPHPGSDDFIIYHQDGHFDLNQTPLLSIRPGFSSEAGARELDSLHYATGEEIAPGDVWKMIPAALLILADPLRLRTNKIISGTENQASIANPAAFGMITVLGGLLADSRAELAVAFSA